MNLLRAFLPCVAAALAVCLAGCFSSSPTLDVRWYSLEALREPQRFDTQSLERQAEAPAQLVLDDVEVLAGEGIASTFMRIDEDGETRFQEGLRWVEQPLAALETRLLDRLVRDPRVRLGASSLGLRVELLEFAERVSDDAREASVVLRATLLEEYRDVRVQRHAGARRIALAGAPALAGALSRELDTVIAALVEELLVPASAP